MGDEKLVEELARAEYEFAALDDHRPVAWVAWADLDDDGQFFWLKDARRMLEWLAERGRLVPTRECSLCDVPIATGSCPHCEVGIELVTMSRGAWDAQVEELAWLRNLAKRLVPDGAAITIRWFAVAPEPAQEETPDARP